MGEIAHLLLTRPEDGSRRVLRAVETRLGHKVPHVISPLLVIRDLDCAAPTSAIPVLTSEQGARRAGELGLTGRAYCVGRRTGAMALAQGMRPEIADGDSDALVALIATHAPKEPLVHVRGRHTVGDVAQRLRAAGLTAHESIAYEQEVQPLNADARALLATAAPVVAPVFSPRSAALLAQATIEARAPLTIVAISAQAAAPFTQAIVAEAPDLPAMVQAITAALQQACSS